MSGRNYLRLCVLVDEITFLKSLRESKGWRDGAWHFLMVRMDELVPLIRRFDLLAVHRYRFLAGAALFYLERNPDPRNAAELAKRVIFDTLPAVNGSYLFWIPEDERLCLRADVEYCKAVARKCCDEDWGMP